MSQPIFYRDSSNNLGFVFKSDETLGILETDYFEDFYGIDGQLTIRSQATSSELVLTLIPSTNLPKTEFYGWIPVASLPNGDYTVEGRCKDVVGNYTIITAFQNSIQAQSRVLLGFSIKDGRLDLNFNILKDVSFQRSVDLNFNFYKPKVFTTPFSLKRSLV